MKFALALSACCTVNVTSVVEMEGAEECLYCISANSFLHWIVSTKKLSSLGKKLKIEIWGFLNFLHFTDSLIGLLMISSISSTTTVSPMRDHQVLYKKNSFCGNYSRKYAKFFPAVMWKHYFIDMSLAWYWPKK